jgi:carboxymethylenebutenolidase
MTNTVIDNVAPDLRAAGQDLVEVFQQHTYAELVKRDAKAAMTTMSSNPYVLFVPLAIGARGWEGVYNFYHDVFLRQLPADITAIPISRVVGKDILVDEAVYQLTHDQVMDWLIPGVPPTHKRLEAGVVAVVKFENGKIASEHVYWDHAGVLAQVGVLDPAKTPVKGVESVRTLLTWAGIKAGG